MIVYAYYNPAPTAPEFQAKFIRLWSESWRKAGWTPRLLTERMAEEHPAYTPRANLTGKAIMATRHFGETGALVTANVINFGLPPFRLAAGGVSFYPGCVFVTKKVIKESARCIKYQMEYDFDICGEADTEAPLRRFMHWNPDDVMRAFQPRC